jgi:hypothetical protein
VTQEFIDELAEEARKQEKQIRNSGISKYRWPLDDESSFTIIINGNFAGTNVGYQSNLYQGQKMFFDFKVGFFRINHQN